MERSGGRVCTAIAVALLLLRCGSRTGIDYLPASDASAGDDAALPEAAATMDGPVVGASCTSAPAGGVAVGSFSTEVISMAIAVAGSTAYAGTSAISQASPLYVGAVNRVPATGGPTEPLAASEFNFGSVATDGARLFYPQSSGQPQGPNGAVYEVLGLASIDLATGAVHPIKTLVPPRSTSSNLNSYMIAASPAWPGVFWIGAPTGAVGASTLASWNPQADSVTTIATGQNLSGLALDGTSVYWADVGGGQGITVYSAPLGGGQPATLAMVPGGSHGQLLGVSSKSVVFVSDYATGAIEVVSKSGGPVTPLVSATSAWVNSFAWVDDNYLYWTLDTAPTTLNRIAVAGGPVTVVPTQGEIQSLAFDECNVYVGTIAPTRILILPKT